MNMTREKRPQCEKMSKPPARDSLSFFLRKSCLYIEDIGKKSSCLFKKVFVLFLQNVDD